MALIVFNDKNEAFFESLIVSFTRPIEQVFRLQETNIEDVDEEIAKFSVPKKQYVDT